MGDHLDSTAYVMRRNTLGLALGGAGAAAAIALTAVALAAEIHGLAQIGVVFFTFSSGLFAACYRLAPEPVALRANRRGLWIGDAFVSAAQLASASVEPFDGGARLNLALRGGATVQLLVKSSAEAQRVARLVTPPAPLPPQPDAFLRGEAAAEAAALSRGDRSFEAWIDHLRKIAAGAGASHRAAPIVPERLSMILESPHAPPILRAAAAIALGPRLTPRERYRVADTAPPRLRIALEGAADPDRAEDLEALLAEMERDEEEIAAARSRER